MTRKYAPLWDRIKLIPPGGSVSVIVHSSFVKTLKLCLIKEKSIETRQRKALGLPFVGPLGIAVVPYASANSKLTDMVEVTFTVSYNLSHFINDSAAIRLGNVRVDLSGKEIEEPQ
jgi:hypothetical protein